MTLTSERKDITTYTDYVTGGEDDDWEYTSSSIDHNFYKGTNVSYSSDGTGLPTQHSITAFCAGCHRVFHEEMGSESPWLRHPSDVTLPQTDEYGAYDPVNNYSTEAPVAWLNPGTPAAGEAIVMCLSCHRAHGSDQPDMLRWDYSAMIAGGDGSGGCFTCHTQKN
jgi:predicted CXXCH cytochrome family protein